MTEYLFARYKRRSAFFIARRTGSDTKIPIMVHINPKMMLKSTAVCTEFCPLFSSPAPMAFDIVTFAPTDQPMKIFTMRFIIDVVVPIAPTASGSQERLTTIVSAAE